MPSSQAYAWELLALHVRLLRLTCKAKGERMLKIISILVVAFFIGCGGGGGSSAPDTGNDNDTPAVVNASYNYNSDGSAARVLNNEYVNQYKAIETELNTLKNNKTAFTKKLNLFLTQILQNASSNDKIPSFAPRGDAKSLVVKVKNSQIDYSAYLLKGDINADNSVDFSDVDALIDALFSSSGADMYDINADGTVDIKDIVELSARLNIHIAYFDFYTTSGQKLNIATRSVNESKIFAYSGDETEVMVVAKDENMASAFEDTLSDLDGVWYKSSGWVHQETTELRVSRGSMINSAIDEALNVTPAPYLIGWHFSVDYVETGYFAELNEDGLEGMEFYLNKTKDKIAHYFRKADMDKPEKTHLSKTHYFYSIGSNNAKQNEVTGKRVSLKESYTKDGKTIYIRQYAAAFSILYESLADKTLTGKITKEPAFNGKIRLKRVGPDKEGDFEGTIKENTVEVKKLPFGEFTPELEDACSCAFSGDKFVFDEGATFSLSLDSNKVNVALTILDTAQNPLKNKNVSLKAKACLNQASMGANEFYEEPEEQTSDSGGKVNFSDVNIGDYEVYVDGKKVKDIHFCASYNDTININSLWKFHVAYSSFLGAGSMSVRNFKLDVNNEKKEYGAIYLAQVFNRDDEGVSISFGGKFSYDDGLMPLTISIINNTTVASYNALMPIDGMEWQMSSTYSAWLIGANGTQCSGDLPSGSLVLLKERESVDWKFSRDGITCNFSLAPCDDVACR